MNKKTFQTQEFKDYLQQLIDAGKLDAFQEGIAKVVIEKGFEALSVKQRHVFLYMMEELDYTPSGTQEG